MEDFDNRLKQALDQEYGADWEKLSGEQRIDEMVLDTFRGRNRLLSIFASIVMFAIFGATVWCITRYIAAENTKELISWAMLAAFGMMAVGMLKLWFWLEIERNATAREIKRLELQVAMLARGLGKDGK